MLHAGNTPLWQTRISHFLQPNSVRPYIDCTRSATAKFLFLTCLSELPLSPPSKKLLAVPLSIPHPALPPPRPLEPSPHPSKGTAKEDRSRAPPAPSPRVSKLLQALALPCRCVPQSFPEGSSPATAAGRPNPGDAWRPVPRCLATSSHDRAAGRTLTGTVTRAGALVYGVFPATEKGMPPTPPW